MFRGVKAINLDAKGRMVLPTRYRDALHERCQGNLVVTADAQDACLLLYPLPEWEEIERKVDALSSFNRVTQGIKRRLIGNATDLELDSSGRVLLPPKLRELAGLEKKIVLVGQRNKFEIWDEEVWNQSQLEWQEQGGLDEEQIPDEIKNLSL